MTWIAIVIGAAVAAIITFLLPDWAAPIGYGIGIFVGRSTSRREFIELIEGMRR